MRKRLADCRIAIVGLGLMGASLAMDLMQKNLCREVRGVARRTSVVLDAFFARAVDLATNDLHTGVMGADIVILATPVRTIIEQLNEIAPTLWPGTIVMDMGSTKAEICEALDSLPAHIQPIGGHPMTGKETGGFESAELNLYCGKTWVLTPLTRTTSDTMALARELVEAVGSHAIVLPAERHDRLVATISHLPFLAASAVVHTALEVGKEDPTVWEVAAGGFRDTTRVAASDTRMFLDILMTNQGAVLEQLDNFIGHLSELRSVIANGDEAALVAKLALSQAARAKWTQKR